MTVLSYTNAFPGVPFPGHTVGQSKPQNFCFPGAVQPLSTTPVVLSYTNAFPGVAFPNHTVGASTPRSYIYPGAVQPLPGQAATVVLMAQICL